MSRLEELIRQLCPDGVEYKKLKDCTEMKRGSSATKSTLVSGDIPVISGGKEPAFYCNVANRVGETITVAGSGAGAGYVQFWDIPIFVNDAFSVKGLENVNTKYAYYVMTNLQEDIYSTKKGGGVPHVHISSIENFLIPVPPLEVQQEIVRILDQFTELTAELIAELTARKKQYEYYRDELLTFGDDVPLATLGDVAVVTKLAGFEFTKYVQYSDSGNIIALRGLNVKNGKLDLTDVKYIDNSDFSKLARSKLHVGDMIFTYVGTIGQVALIDKEDKYYLAPNVALIRSIDDRLSSQYMRYYFQSSNFWKTQINKLLQSSSMQNIPMEKIRKFAIPLPSLNEQHRIVSILDRFDALCNDLTSGLPAEIEARRKQYAYYRDKLLTFKEL